MHIKELDLTLIPFKIRHTNTKALPANWLDPFH